MGSPFVKNFDKYPVGDPKALNRIPSFKQGFNRRWTATSLEVVYVPYNSEGTREATEEALSNYGPGEVRVMSGGHCYEDFVCEGIVKAIINVSDLMQAGHDEEKGYFVSSGDTNWNSFKTLFRNYSKILPGGSCYSVGLGGHICGGGDGIMARLYGLTSDWLTGLEIVVKPNKNGPAQLKYVESDSGTDSEKDLFWAHTGAGPGNFGVVTKYFFKTLPEAPMGFICSYVHFSWDTIDAGIENLENIMDLSSNQIKPGVDKLQSLIDWYFDLAMSEPGDQDPYNWQTVGKMPIFHKATGEFVLFLYTSYFKEDERVNAKEKHWKFEQELNRLGITCEPSVTFSAGHGAISAIPLRSKKAHTSYETYLQDDTLEYTTFSMVQTMNGSGANQRGKYKSAYYRKKVPRHQIETIYRYLHYIPNDLENLDMTQSVIQMDFFGGKINELDSNTTSSPQRAYYVKFQYQTYWMYPSDDQLHLKWIREFYSKMYEKYGGVPDPDHPDEIFQGCYFNYPDVDLNEWKNGVYGALKLYFMGNVPRLIDTKKQWDPENYFQNKQSIPPKTLEEVLEQQK